MPTLGQGLYTLHKLHLALEEVRESLARGRRQIKAREQLILQAEAELAQKTEDLKQLKLGADRKSLDLKTNDAKLLDLERKLNACSVNREYEILKGQIQADKVANSVLQDEILELLDRTDGTQQEIVNCKDKVKKCQEDRTRVAADFEKQIPSLQEETTNLEQKLKEAETVVQGETAITYRRLVEAHGAEALAPVEQGGCSHCNVALTAQTRVQLNSGQLIFCSSCGRMLYVAPKG